MNGVTVDMTKPKRFRDLTVLVLTALLAGYLPTGQAETPMTREQGDAILKELQQIRKLLEKGPPARQAADSCGKGRSTKPVNVKVSIKDSPVFGEEDAPVTIVEFTDYQCPYCKQFHNGAYKQIKTNYVDTGKVRYINRDLPLAFHRQAKPAAHAARCAGEQGKFWELRHLLVVNGNRLTPSAITEHARSLSLDMEPFQTCMDSGRYHKAIDRDAADARAIGVTGTPSFVVGASGGDIIHGRRLEGAKSYGTFEREIKVLLAVLEMEKAARTKAGKPSSGDPKPSGKAATTPPEM